MLYAAIKALISGAIIATVSEVAKRNPSLGALILSLPLTALLAFLWLWFERADNESIAALSQSTFWFVLATLPMFLVMPLLLRSGAGFWLALGICCLLTFAMYATIIWAIGKFGIRL